MKNFFGLLLILCTFFSCQKQDNDLLNDGDNSNFFPSPELCKLNGGFLSTSGDTATIDFTYTDTDFLSSFELSKAGFIIEGAKISYDDIDRTQSILLKENITSTQEAEFHYTGDSTLVSHYTLTKNGESTSVFIKYFFGRIDRLFYLDHNDDTVGYELFHYKDTDVNNPHKIEKYKMNSGDFMLDRYSIYEYDNRKNPFHNQNIMYLFNDFLYPPTKNIKNITVYNSDSSQHRTLSSTYDYNELLLPTNAYTLETQYPSGISTDRTLHLDYKCDTTNSSL